MRFIKKSTILLLPEKSEEAIQIRVPFLYPIWMITLFLCVMTGFGLFVRDYLDTRKQFAALRQLEEEQGEMTAQILRFADLTVRMSEETKGLQEEIRIDPYTEVLTPMESTGRRGVGGSGVGLLALRLPSEPNIPNLVRLMHLSLNRLDEEISALELVGAGIDPFHRGGDNGFTNAADTEASGMDMIHRELVLAAYDLGLDPSLAYGIAKVESGLDPTRISPKGAIGVLQVMPQFVLEEHGVSREMLFDPKINIRIGLLHMKNLLKRFDQNLDLSLAAYNAGASRVVKAGHKIPPIRETRAYVKKVKKAMSSWENLPFKIKNRDVH